MFKCIALLRRKPGLSREDFIDYYERQHAPLIRRLLPGIIDYRRNYVELEGAFLFPGAAPIDFDVITEIWLADRAAYDIAAYWARAGLAASLRAPYVDMPGTPPCTRTWRNPAAIPLRAFASTSRK